MYEAEGAYDITVWVPGRDGDAHRQTVRVSIDYEGFPERIRQQYEVLQREMEALRRDGEP